MTVPVVYYANNPVIPLGATYNGVVGDTLASPAYCWDGTQYVATVGIWNNADYQWGSIFFTSPDLVNWTYINNSLLWPAGSNDDGGEWIIGNAGLAWWRGYYYFVYVHYVLGYQGKVPFVLLRSSDCVNWTTVLNPMSPTQPVDWTDWGNSPSLNVNPVTGALELWLSGNSNSYPTVMWYSWDGITWHASWVSLSWTGTCGDEPSAWYDPVTSVPYVLYCCAAGNGTRYINLTHYINGAWSDLGTVISPTTNFWMNYNCFDPTAICTDLGDGYGNSPRVLFAGGSTNTITAPRGDLSTSIGLVTLLLEPQPSGVLI